MSDERIQIIVKEIKYWKQHKLLPDTYCDYLLALYTQGENEKYSTKGPNKYSITEIFRLSLMFLMLLLAFIVYLIDIRILSQTVLLLTILIFTNFLFIMSQQKLKNNPISITIILMIYLIMSIHLGIIFLKSHFYIIVILLMNLFVWVYLSMKKKLTFLKIVSTIAIVLTLFYILFHYFVT